MSISQARMIDLINAAIDHRNAFDTLCREIDSARGLYEAKQLTAAQALETIYMRAGLGLLKRPAKSRSTIETEYKHFRSNWRRNDRNRIKSERKRRDEGITPRELNDSFFIETGIRTPPDNRAPTPESVAQHVALIEEKNRLEPNAPKLERTLKPIDLSHDEGDPENHPFSVNANTLIEGETDQDRAARRAMVEKALRDFGPKAEQVDYSKLPQVISEKDEKNED